MNKRNIFERRYIIEILAHILGNVDTNQKLSEMLKKKPATIHEQLIYLEKNGLIKIVFEGKRYNEKGYWVRCEKVAELFFRNYLQNEEFLKYKDNDWVTLAFAMFIFSKREHKDVKNITLLDIFAEAHRFFLYRGLQLIEKKDEDKALENFSVEKINPEGEKIRTEFRKFLSLIYDNFQKEKQTLNKEKLKELTEKRENRRNQEKIVSKAQNTQK